MRPDKVTVIKRVLVTEVIPGVLMILFFYTAVSKLLHHAQFVAVLSDSPWINHAPNSIAWAIPVIELAIAGLLFHLYSRKAGLLFSLVLLILFTAYLFAMILSGSELPCSCGGVISSMSWRAHIVFNGFIIVITTVAVVLFPQFNKPRTES